VLYFQAEQVPGGSGSPHGRALAVLAAASDGAFPQRRASLALARGAVRKSGVVRCHRYLGWLRLYLVCRSLSVLSWRP
jgi:hypothetical protein